MTEHGSDHDQDHDHVCPGPHLLCKGCGGQQTELRSTLYVSGVGHPGEIHAPHGCRSCRGRGFFCRHGTSCRGEHNEQTPFRRPDEIPPV
ncbi:hypothetical protein [Streptomyces sp. NPDC007100]|uniref:hypothetical protein n=1 Tax=unclassified Streptomyces TaxID=2593676 RepID=UPI0033F8F4C4